jgi:hypothetical protein
MCPKWRARGPTCSVYWYWPIRCSVTGFMLEEVMSDSPSVSKKGHWLFLCNFDHSSYSNNYASKIYFVCYMFNCCMYFKLDLSFYMFVIIFWMRRMVKVAKKSQWWQIFWSRGSIWEEEKRLREEVRTRSKVSDDQMFECDKVGRRQIYFFETKISHLYWLLITGTIFMYYAYDDSFLRQRFLLFIDYSLREQSSCTMHIRIQEWRCNIYP